MAKRARKSGKDGRLGSRELGPLLKKYPELFHVADKHGVVFCAGCYLTLFSPLERAAAYHAVPNVRRFIEDVRRVVAKGPTARAG